MSALDDTGGLLTIRQVQERLSCSRTKVYTLVNDGRLEQVQFDHGVRITVRSLRLLEASLIASKPRSSTGAK